jgi:hypothetical protein
MIELNGSHPPRIRLEVGDVVMVHMRLNDKQTGKPFWWKWLGAVLEAKGVRHSHFKVIRFGAPEGKDEATIRLNFYSEDQRVWFIPPEEWPDGVHAFRTRLILEGRLDEAVLG